MSRPRFPDRKTFSALAPARVFFLAISVLLLPLAAEEAPYGADESSIVPKSYTVIGVTLESQLSGQKADLRFTRDGVNYSESGERGDFPFLNPLQGQKCSVIRDFGMVRDSAQGIEYFHPGVDFSAAEGAPVLAAASGTVTRTGYTAGYGLFLLIEHGSFSTLYGHLKKGVLVKKGDSVSVGQRIGSVGATGQAEGPLLHYEVRLSEIKGGHFYAVNPKDFMDLSSRAGPRGSASTLAYGADVVIPRISVKGGQATVSFALEDKTVSETGAPSDFPLLHPLGKGKHPVDTGFGLRVNPFSKKREFHTGVDIVSYWGAKIYAAGSGTVAKVGYESGYGFFAIIRHGNLVSLYSHLRDTDSLKEGQSVSAGQVIGRIGNTGATTGPHLHFEIRLVPDLRSGFRESVKQLCDPLSFIGFSPK
jgi:murein DD-endopeptidase MepM/ murein hydrolase activator NlpD